MHRHLLAPLIIAALGCGFSTHAMAGCAVFGDSIALGVGNALNGACPTVAEIGILSSVVAGRVTAGDRWTIVSMGSNDFPAGISDDLAKLSEARVQRSLAEVYGKVGKNLVLIQPSNGGRKIVRDWATAHNVPLIVFEPGPDGIHPRRATYEAMAREVKEKFGK